MYPTPQDTFHPSESPAPCLEPMPAWKRALDILCCLVALPVLGGCALVMSAVTVLVSPGPILFRQERLGWRGQRFWILKFRTMTVNADTLAHQAYVRGLVASNAPMAKLDGRSDARLIPGGWLLRASGLDELPQLLNVLRGEMSLVGPRPCLPAEFEHAHRPPGGRFAAVPGLTGLWQVSGKNRTTFQEMIRLDVHYAHHVSLVLDLKIIVLTPVVLVRQIVDARLSRARPQPTARNPLVAAAPAGVRPSA